MLIKMGNIVIVRGESGSGLTFFVLALCYRIYQGVNVWHEAVQSILYFEGGMLYEEFNSRCELLSYPAAEIEVVSFDRIFKEENNFPSLRDARFSDEYETKVAEGKYKFIVYDNINTLFDKSDQCLNLDDQEICKRFLSKRQRHITQILICSQNSKSIIPIDYADKVLLIENTGNIENLRWNVMIEKSRDKTMDMFQAELQSDENGKLKLEIVDSEDIRAKVLFEAVNGMKQSEIADRFNLNQSTISRWLKQSEDQGFINRLGRKVFLTKAGKELLRSKQEAIIQ